MFHVEQFGNQPNPENVPRGTIWEPAQPGKCSTWNNFESQPIAGNVPRGTLPAKPKQA